MKYFGLKTVVVLLVLGLLGGGAAYAAEKTHVILEGPDVVEAGQTATYTVSTVGGTDSGYTWWLGYTSNDCATIEEGLLTTYNSGIAGIRVSGNDTGATAELHVEVVPSTNGDHHGVSISGPDKVLIGSKAVFTATTGGVPGPGYNWFITYSSSSSVQVAKINADTGELKGVSEGMVIISAADTGSGLSGDKTVRIVNTEEESAVVSIAAGLGEGFTVDLMLSIKGDIPEDAALYLAVRYDGVLHYIPGLGASPVPFRSEPAETYHEKVLSVPVSSIPYREYTFYAALLNSSLELVSNLDTAVVSAGYK